MILWLCFAFGAHKQEDCTDGQGAYMMNYSVHISMVAQLSILNYMNSHSKTKYVGRKGVERFMDNIFDSVNRTLEPYRVQVLGDYSRLTFEELPINIPPDKICETNNAVGTISSAANLALGWPATEGIGNRIIIYQCLLGPPIQIQKNVGRVGDCGNLAVIHSIFPQDIITLLVDIVQGALTYDASYRNSVSSQAYVKNLCSYVKSCAVNNDLIGYLKKGLVGVRNDHESRRYEIAGTSKQALYQSLF